ncbi:DUF4398 domain-containing protein [Aquisalimonas sp.]|uniref:DUF4398 domain-containing protein n=1 Tax=Aquisalimonas sp. TaxID=1872621 RepID=UPI0025C1C6D8|nr:DUF4398 domain-containing protein [Aquisalimonas sp.]
MNQLPLDHPSRQLRLFTCLVLMVLVLGACASTPVPPNDALIAARDAIVTAEQAGARQHAGSELDEARDQLMKAEQAVSNEDMVTAERHAERARVSAELASAQSESSRALAINREMERGAEALTEEMRRTGEQK